MTQFVSYAQNYEDVMLWRALKHVENGFYVDVGANHPVHDSVTNAFYERGWRGINIEPMGSYYEALCQDRPEDINLRVAVGASEGQIIFYEVPETGLSSAVPEAVFASESVTQRDVLARMVPITTLSKILDEHVQGEIHFLKVDVEGYERDVLKGMDFTRWRPWVLVVEATIPNSTTISPDFPEDIILAGDYTFVYFDGLNRFYVANEHLELKEAFSAPPNFFDNFFLSREISALEEAYSFRVQMENAHAELDRVHAEYKRQLAQLYDEGQILKNELAALREERRAAKLALEITRKETEAARRETEIARRETESARHETEAARRETEAARQETQTARNEAEVMRLQYVNILYSVSYRITTPLRSLYRLGARLRYGRRDQAPAPVPVVESVAPVLQPVKAAVVISPQEKREQYFLSFFKREIDRRKNAQEKKLQ